VVVARAVRGVGRDRHVGKHGGRRVCFSGILSGLNAWFDLVFHKVFINNYKAKLKRKIHW
jgi:hypothetical protein